MQRKKQKNQETVTLPVSDTVPAPGSYSVKVINFQGEGLPVVDSTDLIDTTGAGTAHDEVSTPQAPEPGTERQS